MDDEALVLDLDSADPQQHARPQRERLRDVRVQLWVVLLVAIAVAGAAAGLTQSRDAAHARRAQEATLSLMVSVASDADLAGGRTPAGDYRYVTMLRVLNIGPLPITVNADPTLTP